MANFKEGLSKFFDILSKILALVALVTYALVIVDTSIVSFLTDANINTIILKILYYAPLFLVSIVSIEFAVKRNIVLQIIIYVIIAAVIIFSFFPETWQSILNLI